MNLQAADTVILFDTDWNPQAKLKLTFEDLLYFDSVAFAYCSPGLLRLG